MNTDDRSHPMTAPDVNADVRARFEWFVRRELAGELPLDRDPSGEYIAAKTRGALRSWQAAHADLAGEVRELVEAVRGVADEMRGWTVSDGDGLLSKLDAALAKFHPDRRAANYVSGHVDDAGTFHPTHQEKP